MEIRSLEKLVRIGYCSQSIMTRDQTLPSLLDVGRESDEEADTGTARLYKARWPERGRGGAGEGKGLGWGQRGDGAGPERVKSQGGA